MFESQFENKSNKNKDELEIILNPVSEDWQLEYNQIVSDEFISRKYNRNKRLNDHVEYLKSFAPEVLNRTSSKEKYVIDIGPGPGELLEICRALGYKTKGFDAKIEDCEMGFPYVRLSQMMSERQKIDIEYCGFENVSKNLPFKNESAFFVNSRGSIEQVFKQHLEGIPHKIHHDAKQLGWTFSNEMKNDFKDFFTETTRILQSGGIFLIYGNGSNNIDEYNKFMFDLVEEIEGLFIEASDRKTIHRMRKA